jgi:hypothetical protein
VFLLGFPLLIVPLAIYNILAFIIPVPWDQVITTVNMISGGAWRITLSDIIVVVGLFFLFFEIIKATRHGSRAIMDHMLSTVVFIGALVEFLLVDRAATSTFAILLAICLVDVVAGYSVSIRTAQRDYTVERSDLA